MLYPGPKTFFVGRVSLQLGDDCEYLLSLMSALQTCPAFHVVARNSLAELFDAEDCRATNGSHSVCCPHVRRRPGERSALWFGTRGPILTGASWIILCEQPRFHCERLLGKRS